MVVSRGMDAMNASTAAVSGLMPLAGEASIHVRTRRGWELGVSDDGFSLSLKAGDGREFRLAAWTPETSQYQAANERLAAGAPLATLRDLVVAAGGKKRADAYIKLLETLCSHGQVEFPLVDEFGELAVIMPQWESWVPRLAPQAPPSGRSLHHFACVRRVGDSWLVESALSAARFLLAELDALDAPLVRRALAGAGLLEPEQTENGPRQDALAQWEFHDLLFHTRHRLGWHHDPRGGVFPFIGEIDPPPARRQSWPGKRIELPRAPSGSKEPFAEVLARRRSERDFDVSHPISLKDLGALLDRSASVYDSGVMPVEDSAGKSALYEVSRRPSPGGGGCHELEIYPVVNRCEGLEPGIYHYDPYRHALTPIPARTEDVARLVADAQWTMQNTAELQIVLAIAARFTRVMWKYRSISYGVILRNTGALYQTLYLAATELGLSPCASGAGNSALFARITGLDPLVEGTVGEFHVGGKPSPRRAADGAAG